MEFGGSYVMTEKFYNALKAAVFVVLIFYLFFVTACSGEKTYNDASPLSVLQRMQSAKSMKEVMDCYTEGTVKTAGKVMDRRKMSEQALAAAMTLVDRDASWECLREEVKDNSARCDIVITRHPVDNRVGNAITLNMRRGGGQWRIDMEEEMRAYLEGYREDGVSSYLKRKFRGY